MEEIFPRGRMERDCGTISSMEDDLVRAHGRHAIRRAWFVCRADSPGNLSTVRFLSERKNWSYKSRFEAVVVIADNGLHAMKAAGPSAS